MSGDFLRKNHLNSSPSQGRTAIAPSPAAAEFPQNEAFLMAIFTKTLAGGGCEVWQDAASGFYPTQPDSVTLIHSDTRNREKAPDKWIQLKIFGSVVPVPLILPAL
jgi:hypothetical protein